MSRKIAAAVCLALIFGLSAPASAADQVVLRVVAIESDNISGYLKELEKGKALLKKLESPAIVRVWQARFAGRDAGSVVVSVEWPSMAAFAKDEARTSADPEYQTWLKGLSKVRKVVSDSLYNELKP